MLALSAHAMRLTLKTIDDELHRLGHDVHIEKGDGYRFAEFNRLKELNSEILAAKVSKKKTADPRLTTPKPRKSRT